MEQKSEIPVVILAGGASRRMGSDKAALPFGGGTMLSHLVARYGAQFSHVYVSVNRAGRFPTFGAGELPDRRPDQGPLAALETAFLTLSAPVLFLTATDLPFGDPALARLLIADCAGGHDAALCAVDEPLFGAYKRSCLPVLTALLDAGERRMRALLERVDVSADPHGAELSRMLLNVNDKTAYQSAFQG